MVNMVNNMFTVYVRPRTVENWLFLGCEETFELAKARADMHARTFGCYCIVNYPDGHQMHESRPRLTTEQDELVHRVIGQIQYHAIQLRKADRPRDATSVRAAALMIRDIAAELAESMANAE